MCVCNQSLFLLKKRFLCVVNDDVLKNEEIMREPKLEAMFLLNN